MTAPTSRVFVSYATEDADFATVLRQELESAGLGVWIDKAAIKPGANWRSEIDRAILASFAVIVVVSPTSAASKWVTYEWAFALGCGRRVVPLLPKTADYHPRLEDLQFLDFSSHHARPWDDLVAILREEQEQTIGGAPISKQKIHVFGENADGFNKFFGDWYSRPGLLRVFCTDLDWLASTKSEVVVDALLRKGAKLRLYLRNQARDPVAQKLVQNNARFTAIPGYIRSSHRLSIMDNDGIQTIIVRNKDVETDQIVFMETDSYRDPYLIGLALDVLDDCER